MTPKKCLHCKRPPVSSLLKFRDEFKRLIDLTEHDGREHGIVINSNGEKLVKGKQCDGDECAVYLNGPKTGKTFASFHTHPNPKCFTESDPISFSDMLLKDEITCIGKLENCTFHSTDKSCTCKKVIRCYKVKDDIKELKSEYINIAEKIEDRLIDIDDPSLGFLFQSLTSYYLNIIEKLANNPIDSNSVDEILTME